MADAGLLSLAEEIRSLVDRGIAKAVAPMQLRVAELASIVGSQQAEIAALKDEVVVLKKEPRIQVNPTPVQNIVQPAEVHVDARPSIHIPARKPIKRKTTKGPDGSFLTEEVE